MKSGFFKSGIYSILQRGSIFLFGMGSYMILVRDYSKEDFGIWTTFLIFTTLIEMSRTAFIQNGYIKFFHEVSENEQPVLNTASFFLNTLSTIVFVVFLLTADLWLVIFWKSAALGVMLKYYAATAVILIFSTQFVFMQQALGDFRGIFWSSTARQGSFFIIVVFMTMSGDVWPIEYYAMAQIFCALLGVVVAYIFSRGDLRWSGSVKMIYVKNLYNFGKFKIGTGLSAVLSKNVDQLMLGVMLNTSSVAVYNSAVRISNFIEMPTLAVSNATYPRMANEIKGSNLDKACYYYQQTVGTLLALVLPMIVITLLFTELIILIIAGREYLDAVYLARVVLLYTLVIPFNIQFGTIFELLGKPQRAFYVLLFTTIINVVLNYIWIKQFGVEGAAYATLASNVLFFAISQYMLNKSLKINYRVLIAEIPKMYQFLFKRLTNKL